MNDMKDNSHSHQAMLKSYIENNILKSAKKFKGKFLPFSELVEGEPKTLLVKKIYNLKNQLKNFFLIIVRNHSNQPKIRYFIAISLASQSSDFLVLLARDFASKNALKLIQYSLNPKHNYGITLLALRELIKIEEISNSINLLKEFRENFRKKLMNLKSLID